VPKYQPLNLASKNDTQAAAAEGAAGLVFAITKRATSLYTELGLPSTQWVLNALPSAILVGFGVIPVLTPLPDIPSRIRYPIRTVTSWRELANFRGPAFRDCSKMNSHSVPTSSSDKCDIGNGRLLTCFFAV
jgi:hypothetical protein